MKKRGTLFERLKAGLGQAIEFEKGERNLRVTEVIVPEPSRKYTSADVQQIRHDLHLSQAAFALLLQVSNRTIQSWEHGLRTPSQAAARLLQFIEDPQLFDQVTSLKASTVTTRRPSPGRSARLESTSR